MGKKLPKIFERGENMVKTLDMAKEALRNGLGPANDSNKTFIAIPGKIEYDGYFGTDVYYALVVEKSENGVKPVDWYSCAYNAPSEPGFVGGFGGYYKYDYDMLIKYNPWVKDIWDSLRK